MGSSRRQKAVRKKQQQTFANGELWRECPVGKKTNIVLVDLSDGRIAARKANKSEAINTCTVHELPGFDINYSNLHKYHPIVQIY